MSDQPPPVAPWPGPSDPGDAGRPAGWGPVPPPQSYPPGAPSAHWQSWPGYGQHDPNDPLVTPPGAGLVGWWSRCLGALQRSWPVLLPIMLLTQVLPSAVLSLLSLRFDPSANLDLAPAGDSIALPDNFIPDMLTFGGVILVGGILLGLVQSVGWAAGTWVVIRQALGEPVRLGEALRYGLRRAPGLWLWTLLTGLLIGVGICLCVLPGIYLAFALSLVGPVFLFERGNPIGRSFRIFHNRLGMVLGRVALVAAVLIVGSLFVGLLETVGLLPFGVEPMASPASAVGAAAVVLVAALLTLPVYLAQLVGPLMTYAEQRAHEGPVNTAQLAAELG